MKKNVRKNTASLKSLFPMMRASPRASGISMPREMMTISTLCHSAFWKGALGRG